MESSARYREILKPLGLGDEMRVALVDGDACWGYMCLHRELGSRPFGWDEATFLAGAAQVIATGLRASLAPPRPGEAVAVGGPGMILLGPNLEVTGADEAAWAWLEQTASEEWREGLELPVVVQAVAVRLRRARQLAGMPGVAPRARLRTRSGGWLSVRACWLTGPGVDRTIAVMLEPVSAPEVLPMFGRAHALTPREADVVRLVIRGRSTTEMSATLHISEHTVQDHLKSIFDKVGVRSRRELVATLGGASSEA
jgi:DNA-binding CsgD family transcriptional regulator